MADAAIRAAIPKGTYGISAATIHGKIERTHSANRLTDGLGITFARKRIVAPCIDTGRLKPLPGPAMPACWDYCIVYPSHCLLRPAAQQFVDWLLAIAKE